MQQDYTKSISEMGHTALEATKELVEINGKFMGKMLENQMSLATFYVETSEKQISLASQASDPKELFTAQAGLMEECSAKLADATQANAKLAEEAGEEIKAWFEKSMKTADDAVKEATSSATPAPAKKAAPKKAPATKPAAKKAAPKKAPAKKAAE